MAEGMKLEMVRAMVVVDDIVGIAPSQHHTHGPDMNQASSIEILPQANGRRG